MRLAYVVFACLMLWGSAQASCYGENCGICPAGTAPDLWELGEPQFAFGIGPNGPLKRSDSIEDALIDLLPLARSETDCGTDLQVGGSCESLCIYVNAFQNVARIGGFFGAAFTSNGWAAQGPRAGTYCALANYYQFFNDNSYFFLCLSLPWKLCCRNPGYRPFTLLAPGLNFGLERTPADEAFPLPTGPGQIPPLPSSIVDDIMEYKTDQGAKYKGKTAGTVPELPTWARQLVAQKAPGLLNKQA